MISSSFQIEKDESFNWDEETGKWEDFSTDEKIVITFGHKLTSTT